MEKKLSDFKVKTKLKPGDILEINSSKRFNDILQNAIDKWGVDAQLEMILEESIELSLAIQKLKRSKNIDDQIEKYNAVIDEIADNYIMINQAFKIFPIDLINKRIEFKLNRLEKRLKDNEF